MFCACKHLLSLSRNYVFIYVFIYTLLKFTFIYMLHLWARSYFNIILREKIGNVQIMCLIETTIVLIKNKLCIFALLLLKWLCLSCYIRWQASDVMMKQVTAVLCHSWVHHLHLERIKEMAFILLKPTRIFCSTPKIDIYK